MDIRSFPATCGEGCIPQEGGVVWEGYAKGPPAVKEGMDKVDVPLHCMDVKVGYRRLLSPMRGESSHLDVERTSLCTIDALAPHIESVLCVRVKSNTSPDGGCV